jgi:hypothetical protein
VPGGRPISGADVHAAARHLAPPGVDAGLVEAWIPEDGTFATLDELERECPPERIGLTPGGFAALFGPLFGELE